jgi:hypothetical protein
MCGKLGELGGGATKPNGVLRGMDVVQRYSAHSTSRSLPMITSMPRSGRLRVFILAAALIGVAACSDKAKAPATDSSLARDLALAGQQTSEPTFKDTAVAPSRVQAARTNNAPLPVLTRTPSRPAARAPQPAAQAPTQQAAAIAVASAPIPAMPGPAARGEIDAGAGMSLTSGAKVCTSTNLPGDKLVATVNEAITGSNGAIIPAGSTVVLEVANLSQGAGSEGPQINFRVRSVVVNDRTYSVTGDVFTIGSLEQHKIEGDPNGDKKKVIGGAIAGALIGQIIGHNTKGTVIGAATGAAAGAAIAKSGERYESCLPAGAPLRVTLKSGILMS